MCCSSFLPGNKSQICSPVQSTKGHLHTSFFFLQEKLMAKINYFLCEYIQVSYVYCVSYNCCQQKKCSSTFLFFFVKQRGYFCWAFHIRFRAWLTQNLTFCFKRLVQYKALSDSVFFAFDKNGDKLCLKSHFVLDSSKRRFLDCQLF